VILGEIRRLFRDGGTVKVSRSIKELGLKALRTREQLSIVLGRDPTVGEVAKAMDRPPEEIAEALAAATPPLSLTGDDEEGGGQMDLPVVSPEEHLSDLLSLKPIIYAANLDEDTFAGGYEDYPYYLQVKQLAEAQGAQVLPICAKVEQEIAELDAEEKEMGLNDSKKKEPLDPAAKEALDIAADLHDLTKK
jgi:hypothetical protein